MKARRLIEGASYDPATLKALYKAFDDAWEQIAPLVSKRGGAIEAARMKLAEIVLSLAKDGHHEPQHLTRAALKLMLGIAAGVRPGTQD
jgi:hypothetical protein